MSMLMLSERGVLHLLAREHPVLADLGRVLGVEVVPELYVAEEEDQQRREDRQRPSQVRGLREVAWHLLEDVQVTDSLLERHLLLTRPPWRSTIQHTHKIGRTVLSASLKWRSLGRLSDSYERL